MAFYDGHNYSIFYDDIDLNTRHNLVAVTPEQYENQSFGIGGVNQYDSSGTVLIKQVLNKQILEMTFVRVVGNKIVKLTNSDRDKFSQLFFRRDKEIHALVVGDICYYVMPIDGTLQDLRDSSYFTITFEVVSDTGLSRVRNNSYKFLANATNEIEIINNGLDLERLDLEIEATATTNISINGNGITAKIVLDTGKCLISGENNELVNCEFTGGMVNLRELLGLKIGYNLFTITTDKEIKVKTSYQETLGVR